MPKPNWTSGLTGGAGGAATGFAAAGPWGGAAGGVLGLLTGLFGENLNGKDKVKQAGNLSPEQQLLTQLINQGLTSGDGPFGSLFGDFNQGEFEAGVTNPALKDFQDNILPMLKEKYIAGNQAGGSSQQAGLMKAGTDLQSKLAQLMYQAKQEQLKNKLSGIQTALGVRPFENYYKQGEEGFGTGLLKGAAPAFGKGVANLAFDRFNQPATPAQNPANPPNAFPQTNQTPIAVG